MDWTGGALGGTGLLTVDAGATLNMDGASALVDGGVQITNNGSANWTAGDITTLGVTFDNTANGTFNVQGELTWYDMSGTSLVSNEGTMLVEANAVVSYQVAFDTTFELSMITGTLQLSGGGVIGGTINTAAGATTDLADGNFQAQPSAQAAGQGTFLVGSSAGQPALNIAPGAGLTATQICLIGGTITGPGPLTVTRLMIWRGGTLEGDGDTTIAQGATLRIAAGAPRSLRRLPQLEADRDLENDGTVNYEGYAFLILGVDVTWRNYGTFNITSSEVTQLAILVDDPDPAVVPTFLNQPGGVLNIGDWGATIGGMNFNNDGAVNVLAGAAPAGFTLQNCDGFHSGTFNAAAGTIVRFNGGTNYLWPRQAQPYPMLAGAGTYLLDSGTLTVVDGKYVRATNFVLEGGTVNGPGTFNAHSFLWTGGSMSDAGETIVEAADSMSILQEVVLNGRTLVNHGRVYWEVDDQPGSQINVTAGATIDNDGGDFDVGNDVTLLNTDNSAAKILVRNGGTFYVEPEDPLVNPFDGADIGVPLENRDGGNVEIKGNVILTTCEQTAHGSSTYITSTPGFTPTVFFCTTSDMKIRDGFIGLAADLYLGLKQANAVGSESSSGGFSDWRTASGPLGHERFRWPNLFCQHEAFLFLRRRS
jgi:hypothetical protein